MGIVLSLFALCLVFLEGVIAMPFSLIILLCLMIFVRKLWVFAVALCCGSILDIILFRDFGSTSVFFVLSLFLVFLYERKFTTRTYPFSIIISGIAAGAYCIFFGLGNTIFVVMMSMIFASLLFFCATFFTEANSDQKLAR